MQPSRTMARGAIAINICKRPGLPAERGFLLTDVPAVSPPAPAIAPEAAQTYQRR
jgi:hypothetical protein